MTWYTDDRRLYWEQRRLDAAQAEACRQPIPEVGSKTKENGGQPLTPALPQRRRDHNDKAR